MHGRKGRVCLLTSLYFPCIYSFFILFLKSSYSSNFKFSFQASSLEPSDYQTRIQSLYLPFFKIADDSMIHRRERATEKISNGGEF